MKHWIAAIRPKTLLASIGPVLLGLSVAFYQNGKLNYLIGLLTLICALMLQMASNLANDYLDGVRGVDNESRLGPTRMTSSGLIDASTMKNALIICLFIAFILGLYLMWVGGPVIMAFGLFSLYFAYGYTGGPYPLSYKGLGEVAAFIFFGPVAVIGTIYLQTQTFPQLGLILGMGPGFISACILAINNLRDIKSDEETNKRTLAVRFGEKFQRMLCLWLVVMSAVVVLVTGFLYEFKWSIFAFILPLFYGRTWVQIAQHPIDAKLNGALAKTAQYNLFYCLILSMGLAVTKALLQ